MSLINCPECNHAVSQFAHTCPQCAHPLDRVPLSAPDEPPLHSWKTVMSLAARLGIGGILLVGGVFDGEVSGIIGGALIAGSVVPAWYRAQFERWRARRAIRPIDEDLAERVADLEHRHLSMLTELEERVDFTERLLSKQRDLSPVP